MGHCIRAIIGKRADVQKIAGDWPLGVIELPQDFGMVMLTNRFLDDVEELYECGGEDIFPELDGFFAAVRELMEQYSIRTKLAYIETDYFGGVGTQGGVLYENGKPVGEPTVGRVCEPKMGTGVINGLLKALGVWREHGKDEFESLELFKYRRME